MEYAHVWAIWHQLAAGLWGNDTVHDVHLIDPRCHKICDALNEALMKATKAAEARSARAASVVAAEEDDVQEEDDVHLLSAEEVSKMVRYAEAEVELAAIKEDQGAKKEGGGGGDGAGLVEALAEEDVIGLGGCEEPLYSGNNSGYRRRRSSSGTIKK
jgi:hypothetical protein